MAIAVFAQIVVLKSPAARCRESSTVRKSTHAKIRSLALQSRHGGTGNALAVAVQAMNQEQVADNVA
ncbi:MAG: hypothetical protein JRF18_07300 [Deltaproteobacteria bacterium]|nr:hypothetical protein [Deltaproteobacteria bacterium]